MNNNEQKQLFESVYKSMTLEERITIFKFYEKMAVICGGYVIVKDILEKCGKTVK